MKIILQGNNVILTTKLGTRIKGRKKHLLLCTSTCCSKRRKDSLLLCHMTGEGAGWNQIRGQKEKSTFGNLVTKTFCY
jgi:hypothetical protein